MIVVAAIVLALSIPGPASPQDAVVDSRWAAQPPALDGQPGDWPPDTLTLLKKLRIDCSFRNDDRNLYVVLVFRDPKFLSSIGVTGLKVYARPEGANPDTNGVLFLGRSLTAEAFIARLEGEGIALTETEKEYFRIQPRHPVFEAHTIDANGRTVAFPPARPGVDPPSFRAAKAGDVTTFELRIPLAAQDVHPAGAGAGPGGILRVSFEWGGKPEGPIRGDASWPTASSRSSSGAIDSNQESRAQNFLSSFDPMSGPGPEPKRHKFQAVVKLAEAR